MPRVTRLASLLVFPCAASKTVRANLLGGTMDEALHEAPAADDWRTNLASSVQDQRRRAREQLDQRRDRLRELESRITSQLDSVAKAIDREQREGTERRGDAQAQTAAIEQRQHDLSARQQEFDRRHQAWEAAQREADRRIQQLLDDVSRRLSELDRRQAEQNDIDQRLQASQVALARREAELDNLAGEIDRRQATIAGTASDLDQ